ncbi:hypothetical protein F5Y15DRAFT_425547 [Xylariaceae sp. FL0016]|nr:hypothetical protein F5Y15DRAFT_425547 [Xylariaceae sp. FL0016]
MASISIRKSIRWLPEPASEPTSTVVLTSPGRRFVDIRILHPVSPERREETTHDEVNLPPSRIDWAFAGTSHPEMRGDGVRHNTWRHFVSSRTREPDLCADEGDMYPQPDGTTLELGRMVNPATGKETDYEEVWTDVDAEGISDDGGQQKPRQVVLEIRRDESEERGMVVCLGRFCQGVVRSGDLFALERWQWIGGDWKQQYRSGSLWLPCAEAMRSLDLSLGGQLKHDGQVWHVVEL